MAHPADPHCTTCNGLGSTPPCADCGGDCPATGHGHHPPPPPPGTWKAKAKKAAKVLGILGAIVGVLALAIWGIPKAYNALTYKGSGDTNASAPAPTGSTNLDPTKPPATASASAKSKTCPPGTLLDTERDVCVERSAPVTIPSAITVNIPCPGSCGSAAPSTSASAPPAPLASATPTATATATPTAPKPPAPAVIPVRIDLTKVMDPARFPSGN